METKSTQGNEWRRIKSLNDNKTTSWLSCFSDEAFSDPSKSPNSHVFAIEMPVKQELLNTADGRSYNIGLNQKIATEISILFFFYFRDNRFLPSTPSSKLKIGTVGSTRLFNFFLSKPFLLDLETFSEIHHREKTAILVFCVSVFVAAHTHIKQFC